MHYHSKEPASATPSSVQFVVPHTPGHPATVSYYDDSVVIEHRGRQEKVLLRRITQDGGRHGYNGLKSMADHLGKRPRWLRQFILAHAPAP